MSDTSKMSLLDKFGLGTGIVGLIVDVMSLATFVYGLFGFQQPDIATSVSFRVWSGVLMLYAWVIISWVLVRRSFVQRNRPQDFNYKEAATTIFTGMGIGIALIYLFWAWPFWLELTEVKDELDIITFIFLALVIYYLIGAVAAKIFDAMPYVCTDMPTPKPQKETSSAQPHNP